VELGIVRDGRLKRISVMVEEHPLSLSGTTQPKGPERVDFQPLDWTSPDRWPVHADRAF